jgi:ferritin
MLSQTIQDAMNEQIRELYSAYLYLSMSAYCESINLAGFAHWMRMQAQEEVCHAMRFYGCL